MTSLQAGNITRHTPERMDLGNDNVYKSELTKRLHTIQALFPGVELTKDLGSGILMMGWLNMVEYNEKNKRTKKVGNLPFVVAAVNEEVEAELRLRFKAHILKNTPKNELIYNSPVIHYGNVLVAGNEQITMTYAALVVSPQYAPRNAVWDDTCTIFLFDPLNVPHIFYPGDGEETVDEVPFKIYTISNFGRTFNSNTLIRAQRPPAMEPGQNGYSHVSMNLRFDGLNPLNQGLNLKRNRIETANDEGRTAAREKHKRTAHLAALDQFLESIQQG